MNVVADKSMNLEREDDLLKWRTDNEHFQMNNTIIADRYTSKLMLGNTDALPLV